MIPEQGNNILGSNYIGVEPDIGQEEIRLRKARNRQICKQRERN